MQRLLHQFDRLRGTAAARRLQQIPGLARVYQSTRAVVVQEHGRFLARELVRRRGVYAYTLADGRGTVMMRHRTPDVTVLDELFWWGFYDPPAPVGALLGRAGVHRIADVGGNVGMFGVLCLRRWPGSTVVAVEPDPENAAIYRQTMAANGVRDTWTLVEAAAATAAGEVAFHAGDGAQSRVADTGAIGTTTVPAIDAFDVIADVDLLKLDIEGSEWAILADERFAMIRATAVLLEYHGEGAPTGRPHEDAERLLRAAGFTGYQAQRLPGDLGIAWAWREPVGP